MKNRVYEPLSKAMGCLLADRICTQFAKGDIDAITPIPMHWSRRIYRGTNSPEFLAEQLAWRLGCPANPQLLRRRRATPSQGQLSRRQRLRNLRQAFEAARGYDLAGSRILLVDDVMTTGATCNDAARALRQAGVMEVHIAVIARADE